IFSLNLSKIIPLDRSFNISLKRCVKPLKDILLGPLSENFNL
ncbi:unnamed protein product, partial [Heterotrigona itama]